MFQCQWVKPNAVVMDEYGLTTVELESVGYKDDQWVLANRVTQVAYSLTQRIQEACGCVRKAKDRGS